MVTVQWNWPLQALHIVTPGIYLVTMDAQVQTLYGEWNPTFALRAGFTGTVDPKLGDSWAVPLIPESAAAIRAGVTFEGTDWQLPGFAVGGRAQGRVVVTRPYSFAAADILIPFANVVMDSNLEPLIKVNYFGAIYLPTGAVPPTNAPLVAEANLGILSEYGGPALSEEGQFGSNFWVSPVDVGPWDSLEKVSCFIQVEVPTGITYAENTGTRPPAPTGSVTFYGYNILTTSPRGSFPVPGTWSPITTVAVDVDTGEAAWTGAGTYLNTQSVDDTHSVQTTTWITAMYSGDGNYPPSYAVPMAFAKAAES